MTHCTWCYLNKASVRSQLETTTSTWSLLLEKKTFTCLLGVCGKTVFLVSQVLCAVWVEEEKLKVGIGFSFLSPGWMKQGSTRRCSNSHVEVSVFNCEAQSWEDTQIQEREWSVGQEEKECTFLLYFSSTFLGYCVRKVMPILCLAWGGAGGAGDSWLTRQSYVIGFAALFFSLLLSTIPQVCRKKLFSHLSISKAFNVTEVHQNLNTEEKFYNPNTWL